MTSTPLNVRFRLPNSRWVNAHLDAEVILDGKPSNPRRLVALTITMPGNAPTRIELRPQAAGHLADIITHGLEEWV